MFPEVVSFIKNPFDGKKYFNDENILIKNSAIVKSLEQYQQPEGSVCVK
jgi:hypothetical protein